MEFQYKSNDFKTKAQCKKEIALLKKELCIKLDLERDQFRLSNGLIILYGYNQETKSYIPLSSTIYKFDEKIKSALWSTYYVYCNLQTK